MKQVPYASTIATCRAALRVGHLTKDGRNWIFGRRRRFRPRTVNALIDNGEAVRVGDHIVAWRTT